VGTLDSLTETGDVAAGNVSGTTITGTDIVGTLHTAAQPNITTVGTLDSLIVTGDVAAGNVSGTTITGTPHTLCLGCHDSQLCFHLGKPDECPNPKDARKS
jgi:hypothetical protein